MRKSVGVKALAVLLAVLVAFPSVKLPVAANEIPGGITPSEESAEAEPDDTVESDDKMNEELPEESSEDDADTVETIEQEEQEELEDPEKPEVPVEAEGFVEEEEEADYAVVDLTAFSEYLQTLDADAFAAYLDEVVLDETLTQEQLLLIYQRMEELGAEDTDEHEGNEVSDYEQFKSAVQTYQGTDPIVLEKDIIVPENAEGIKVYTDVVIDLNGFTIDATNVTNVTTALFDIQSNKSLTIQDSSAEHSGAVNNSSGRVFVLENGAQLSITGGSFSHNTTTDSGAVIYSTEQGVTVVIGGTASFTNNQAKIYGGAIYLQGEGTVLTINGGTFENNSADCQQDLVEVNHYPHGGGAVYMTGRSVTLNITSGTFTNNHTCGGGGAVALTRNYDDFYGGWGTSGTLNITGGSFAGNVSETAEGGALSIGAGWSGSITGGSFTNNETHDTKNWGGGAIFIAQDASLFMQNAWITGNTAKGFGGGIGGCSTGRMFIHNAAIYGNYADGTALTHSEKNADILYADPDPVFRYMKGYQDFYCALGAVVVDEMLGGGNENWYGSADGQSVGFDEHGNPVGVPEGAVIVSSNRVGLTAVPSQQDMDKAQAARWVTINGNSSATHGGAIMCNGVLMLGRKEDVTIPKSVDFCAFKDFISLDGKYDGEHADCEFILYDEKHEIITVGQAGYWDAETIRVKETVDGKEIFIITEQPGEIKFDQCLHLAEAGTYTYYIQEKQGAYTTDKGHKVTSDPREYKIVFTLEEKSESIKTSEGEVILHYFVIASADVYINEDGTWKGAYCYLSNNDKMHTTVFHVRESLNSPTFVNTITDELDTTISVTMNKVWDDENNADHIRGSYSVALFLGDEQVGESIVLNPWKTTYTWKDLAVVEGKEYSVKEVSVPEGYTSSTETANAAVVDGVAIITNTHVPGLEIQVSKTWVDAENQDGIRPTEIKVTLCADGAEVPDSTLVLKSENDYTDTWTDLPAKKDGKLIVYTVKEETVTGYTLTKATPSSVTVDGQWIKKVELENTHVPSVTSVEVEKKWNDTDLSKLEGYERPEKVIVYITGVVEGKTVVAPARLELNAENQWKSTVDNLPEFSNGHKVTYVVSEESIPGYTSKIEGTTITNTPVETDRNITPITLSILKVDDKDEKITLEGAIFEISKGGVSLGALPATDKNGLTTYVFTEAGTYVISEKTAPVGYQKTDKTWTVTIAEGSVTVAPTNENLFQKVVSLIWADKQEESFANGVLTIKNTKVPETPSDPDKDPNNGQRDPNLDSGVLNENGNKPLDGTQTTTKPDTGDHSSAEVWFVMMMVSAACMRVLSMARRKRED